MPAQMLFGSGSAQMTYEVLEEGVSGPDLCEAYHFDTLGAFLYQDFFHGLTHHFLYNRCKHCGRYFLLAGGKYSDYCENPLAVEELKSCRDIGSRKNTMRSVALIRSGWPTTVPTRPTMLGT